MNWFSMTTQTAPKGFVRAYLRTSTAKQ
ncbi:resolvase, partial [Salmonella enterica subsp. enterica serovar Kentucky]|nr:resolvase [Salmonella enterica subsp. enterica serovar Kentucky]